MGMVGYRSSEEPVRPFLLAWTRIDPMRRGLHDGRMGTEGCKARLLLVLAVGVHAALATGAGNSVDESVND